MTIKQNIGILGMGNLGTALAQVIASNGFSVLGWAHSQEVVDDINHNHHNQKYVSEKIYLHSSITATHSLQTLITQSSTIFVCLPSRHLYATIKKIDQSQFDTQISIVNTSKGIDHTTRKPTYRLLQEFFPRNIVCQISGPMIANEFILGKVTAGVVACPKNKHSQVAKLFTTTNLHISQSQDVTGVVWAGILKNIYAIGVGMLDTITDNNANTKGIYLTKALQEMTQFAQTQGAEPDTMYSIAGIGDLLTTSLSPNSHNRSFGCRISQNNGHNPEPYVPEGCQTLEVLFDSNSRYKTHSMPLAHLIYEYTHQTISLQEWYQHSMEGYS